MDADGEANNVPQGGGNPPSEPSIFGDSQPDQPAPQVVSAAEHAQHPFFAGARGRGAGGGRGRGGTRPARQPRGSAQTAANAAGPGAPAAGGAAANNNTNNNTALIVPDDERPLFGPISLRELEFAQRRNADGAESSVWSDDDDEDDNVAGPSVRKRKRRKKASSASTSRGRPPLDANDEDAMAAAAFGGGGVGEDECGEEEDDAEDEGEDGDEQSVANESSIADGARLLPIRGETCVGCICDRSVIETVDRFVRANAVCMTETALYKAAALHYKNEVMIPRRREGVRVLPWKWKDLQAHYVLHTCDPLLQRAAAVRSLGAVRAVQEQNLMRHNADGTKVLDHKGAELLLKIVALQDKQLLALDAARMPPPPTRGGGAGR